MFTRQQWSSYDNDDWGARGIPKFLVESNQETTHAASQIVLDSQILTEANIDIEDSEFSEEYLRISQRGFYVLNRYTRICTPQNKLHVSNISKFYADMLVLYRFDRVFQDSSKFNSTQSEYSLV